MRTISTDRVVIDASAAVAMLVDAGPAGEWAASQAIGARLAAPDFLPYEAGNIPRRHVLALDFSAATLAHSDLIALPFDLCRYTALAERAWALRGDLTVYDAAYVALAELLGVPPVTLDARLARAPGPRCQVLAFESS